MQICGYSQHADLHEGLLQQTGLLQHVFVSHVLYALPLCVSPPGSYSVAGALSILASGLNIIVAEWARLSGRINYGISAYSFRQVSVFYISQGRTQ